MARSSGPRTRCSRKPCTSARRPGLLPLADHPICRGLSPEQVESFEKLLEPMRFEAGDTIVRKGENADHIFFLVEGEVSVVTELPNGELKRLSTLSRGMSFGELAALTRSARSADVRADEASVCHALSLASFERLPRRIPTSSSCCSRTCSPARARPSRDSPTKWPRSRSSQEERSMLGLVLTAGGARGAYQAGVLARLGELPGLRERPSPFAIIAGASAGAINGSLLAARGARFGEATRELARLWSNLRVEDVFASDACSLARAGATLAFDFTLGALLGRTRTHGLLDTAPLGRLLERSFPARGIADGIRRGRLYAVAVTATSYHSGRSFTFVEGRPGHPVWAKSRRLVLPVSLTSRHVMASSAIPIVFPPVRVSSQAGDLWFGDGGLRLVTPLSPAIRLGASQILSIGVRSSRAADSLAREEAGAVASPGEGPPRLPCPPLAQVTGVFLNAIFLDHLDADLDHLNRMNEIVASGQRDAGARASEPIRSVSAARRSRRPRISR